MAKPNQSFTPKKQSSTPKESFGPGPQNCIGCQRPCHSY